MSDESDKHVVVIGAGPAGLTAAYELAKYGLHPIVLEQYDKVGGLARTENYRGFYFDMGGHRFFTKAQPVAHMWHDILGADFLLRPRLSRIYYQDKFFFYPLKYANALAGVGIWQAVLIVGSFIKWQVFPYKKEDTFEHWVTNRFGKRLFEMFFKTYTEKVWGVPCSELKAEFAAQRIKDLSLRTALTSVLVKPKHTIKTLIEEFHYPRLGPGMLWNEVKNQIEMRNGAVHLNSSVVRIELNGSRIHHVVVSQNGSGEKDIEGASFISSMPITELIKKIDVVPPHVLQAANKLAYRDFLTVCLIVDQPDLFPDNWIYVHSPGVRVGRIQNFKNWSPDMVPDLSKTSLGLEYFCTEGDDLWNMPDADLLDLGKRELERMGLAKAVDVVDGCVFRVPKAYPIYDSDYRAHLNVIKEFVQGIENLQTIGRNGLHRYNNQDHSMITGMLAVRNLVLGEQNDLWSVNTDEEYQEEIRVDKEPSTEKILTDAFVRIFPRLDPIAFGLAAGMIAGASIFLGTLFLTLKGGDVVGPNLQLLSIFLPGFSVSGWGALVGLFYLFSLGFIVGSSSAYLRNLMVWIGARLLHRDIELDLLRRLYDFL